MSTPAFTQPERRSFLVPILLALAALAVAIAVAIHFFPATTVNISHVQTDILPTETVFKGSTVIGVHDVSRTLYVASRVRVDNQLRIPIYLDEPSLTFTLPDGSEVTAAAVQKNDLADLETNYPGLKPLLTMPLVRNTEIEPGKSAEGTLLFPLQIPKEMWSERKSAVIKLDVYHQPSLYLTIPK